MFESRRNSSPRNACQYYVRFLSINNSKYRCYRCQNPVNFFVYLLPIWTSEANDPFAWIVIFAIFYAALTFSRNVFTFTSELMSFCVPVSAFMGPWGLVYKGYLYTLVRHFASTASSRNLSLPLLLYDIGTAGMCFFFI